MQDGTWLLNLSHAGLANPQKSRLSTMIVSDGDAKAVVQTSSAAAASSVQLPTSRIILVWKPKEATEKAVTVKWSFIRFNFCKKNVLNSQNKAQ